MSLGKKVLRSTGWTTGGMVITQVLNLGRLALLARLLSPEDFGLYAMALVFFAFVQTFAHMGTSAALIQKKDHTATLASSVFFINIAIGLCLSVAVYFISPAIAAIYGEPDVAKLLQLLSLVFFIASFGFVHSALLRREMNFAGVVKADVLANLISSVLCIYLALNDFRAYSFVYQMLTLTTLNMLFLWYFSRWKPSLVISLADIKSVFNFSANLTLFGIVDYIARNIDKFLVGKYLGTAALGSYYMGYRVILMPLKQITNSVKNVLFSALAKLQDDDAKFRQVFLKVVYIVAFFTVPLMLVFIPVADLFTLAIIGKKWEGAIGILRVFAPLGMIQSLVTPVSIIYLVKNQTGLLLKFSFLNVLILSVGVIIGLRGDVFTVAIAVVVATIVFLIPVMRSGLAFIGLKLSDMFQVLYPIFIRASAVALLAWLIKSQLLAGYDWHPGVKLVLIVALSAIVYLSISVKSLLREYRYLKQFI